MFLISVFVIHKALTDSVHATSGGQARAERRALCKAQREERQRVRKEIRNVRAVERQEERANTLKKIKEKFACAVQQETEFDGQVALSMTVEDAGGPKTLAYENTYGVIYTKHASDELLHVFNVMIDADTSFTGVGDLSLKYIHDGKTSRMWYKNKRGAVSIRYKVYDARGISVRSYKSTNYGNGASSIVESIIDWLTL